MHSNAELAHFIFACHAPRRLSGMLHTRKQQADKYSCDCDYDKQLNERDASRPIPDVRTCATIHEIPSVLLVVLPRLPWVAKTNCPSGMLGHRRFKSQCGKLSLTAMATRWSNPV